MAPTGKTAPKTAPPPPQGGARLPLGNHPGNTGGKKGRSGRKPSKFLALCEKASSDPTLWKEARAKNPNHVLELSGSYTEPKPKQGVEVSGSVTIHHAYDE